MSRDTDTTRELRQFALRTAARFDRPTFTGQKPIGVQVMAFVTHQQLEGLAHMFAFKNKAGERELPGWIKLLRDCAEREMHATFRGDTPSTERDTEPVAQP